MGDPSDIGALTLAVGEMRGQLREMIHAQGGMAQKIDFLTEKALLAPTTTQIADLAKRVDALEATNDRNDGAKGVFAAILQSRFAAWVAAAIGGAYIAFDKGVFK